MAILIESADALICIIGFAEIEIVKDAPDDYLFLVF